MKIPSIFIVFLIVCYGLSLGQNPLANNGGHSTMSLKPDVTVSLSNQTVYQAVSPYDTILSPFYQLSQISAQVSVLGLPLAFESRLIYDGKVEWMNSLPKVNLDINGLKSSLASKLEERKDELLKEQLKSVEQFNPESALAGVQKEQELLEKTLNSKTYYAQLNTLQSKLFELQADTQFQTTQLRDSLQDELDKLNGIQEQFNTLENVKDSLTALRAIYKGKVTAIRSSLESQLVPEDLMNKKDKIQNSLTDLQIFQIHDQYSELTTGHLSAYGAKAGVQLGKWTIDVAGGLKKRNLIPFSLRQFQMTRGLQDTSKTGYCRVSSTFRLSKRNTLKLGLINTIEKRVPMENVRYFIYQPIVSTGYELDVSKDQSISIEGNYLFRTGAQGTALEADKNPMQFLRNVAGLVQYHWQEEKKRVSLDLRLKTIGAGYVNLLQPYLIRDVLETELIGKTKLMKSKDIGLTSLAIRSTGATTSRPILTMQFNTSHLINLSAHWQLMANYGLSKVSYHSAPAESSYSGTTQSVYTAVNWMASAKWLKLTTNLSGIWNRSGSNAAVWNNLGGSLSEKLVMGKNWDWQILAKMDRNNMSTVISTNYGLSSDLAWHTKKSQSGVALHTQYLSYRRFYDQILTGVRLFWTDRKQKFQISAQSDAAFRKSVTSSTWSVYSEVLSSTISYRFGHQKSSL